MADVSKFSPDGGTTIYDIRDPKTMSAAESLTRDTTGWTGKNLIETPYTDTRSTINGVSCTINDDGSITLSGTSTGTGSYFLSQKSKMTDHYKTLSGKKVIISGGLNNNITVQFWSNSTGVKVSTGQDMLFELPNLETESDWNFVIHFDDVFNNNTYTIYPMLRYADIVNSTYEPYHKTVLEELSSRISTFNGRSGSVLPMAGDYDATQVNYSAQQTVKQKIDAVAGVWTSAVSCLVGDTTATIQNSAIHTTSIIDNVFTQTSSGNVIAYTNVAVTEGQAVITWASALTEAASVKLHILNL